MELFPRGEIKFQKLRKTDDLCCKCRSHFEGFEKYCSPTGHNAVCPFNDRPSFGVMVVESNCGESLPWNPEWSNESNRPGHEGISTITTRGTQTGTVPECTEGYS